jgi:hypothetical protein
LWVFFIWVKLDKQQLPKERKAKMIRDPQVSEIAQLLLQGIIRYFVSHRNHSFPLAISFQQRDKCDPMFDTTTYSNKGGYNAQERGRACPNPAKNDRGGIAN